MEADEKAKALEIWRTVLDQFPRSKVRFDAHMRIGEYLLTSKGAFDEARKHFESAAQEDNRDDAMRAQATLKQGVCFYEARLYGKCFKVFRKIIEDFPASEETGLIPTSASVISSRGTTVVQSNPLKKWVPLFPKRRRARKR